MEAPNSHSIESIVAQQRTRFHRCKDRIQLLTFCRIVENYFGGKLLHNCSGANFLKSEKLWVGESVTFEC